MIELPQDIQEAVVVHRGDTLIFRFNTSTLTMDRAAEMRKLLIERLGHLVEDIVVVSADGIAVIRGGA